MTTSPPVIDVYVAQPTDAAAAKAALGPAERDRMAKLQVPADRVAFAVAHGLLRAVLNERLPLPFDADFQRSAQGKPQLPPPLRLHFNLSHARHLVAVAVSEGVEVGVDVEDLARQIDPRPLAPQVLSDVERAEMSLTGWHSRDFLRLWVMKEALAKAVGQGLYADFRHISLTGSPLRILSLPTDFGPPGNWSTDSRVIDGHQISVAAPHNTAVWRWHAAGS